jgi:hypothetical protein
LYLFLQSTHPVVGVQLSQGISGFRDFRRRITLVDPSQPEPENMSFFDGFNKLSIRDESHLIGFMTNVVDVEQIQNEDAVKHEYDPCYGPANAIVLTKRRPNYFLIIWIEWLDGVAYRRRPGCFRVWEVDWWKWKPKKKLVVLG